MMPPANRQIVPTKQLESTIIKAECDPFSVNEFQILCRSLLLGCGNVSKPGTRIFRAEYIPS